MRLSFVLAVAVGLAVVSWAAEPEVEIRMVYDNSSARSDLPEDWGFSALVTFGGHRVLFDAGADGDTLLRNLGKIGVPIDSITHAVISHQHLDHREGVHRLAMKNRAMAVYYLDAFPADAFELAMAMGISPKRVTGPETIVSGVFTTGAIKASPPEQSLVIETSRGLVVLTGCAHPGVVEIVKLARQQADQQKVRLLVGGFHMLRQKEERIREQIVQLRELGVEQIAPAHCTGERAKRLFRREWGPDYLVTGAGRTIALE